MAEPHIPAIVRLPPSGETHHHRFPIIGRVELVDEQIELERQEIDIHPEFLKVLADEVDRFFSHCIAGIGRQCEGDLVTLAVIEEFVAIGVLQAHLGQ